ncbi:MAG: hypothetical protein EOP49_26065 [Sphingobacteriales bacterium]|nr:MAG: hypothetical protein EOP49_26065 [Sphingobacteriales bacterium]
MRKEPSDHAPEAGAGCVPTAEDTGIPVVYSKPPTAPLARVVSGKPSASEFPNPAPNMIRPRPSEKSLQPLGQEPASIPTTAPAGKRGADVTAIADEA